MTFPAAIDQVTVNTDHKRPAVSRVTVELQDVIVPVPPENLETWRRGIARMYDFLDALIQEDEISEKENQRNEQRQTFQDNELFRV